MLTAFLGIAMVFGLSAAAPGAKPVDLVSRVHIASAHVDAGSPDEPRDPPAPTATDDDVQQTSSGRQASQSSDSDAEPESIGGGSEP